MFRLDGVFRLFVTNKNTNTTECIRVHTCLSFRHSSFQVLWLKWKITVPIHQPTLVMRSVSNLPTIRREIWSFHHQDHCSTLKMAESFPAMFVNFNYTTLCQWPGSVVGIATDYGLDGPGIESRWGEIFRSSRPVLGSTQHHVQWVPGTHDVAGRWLATSWVHYATGCNTQTSAPQDWQNNCLKHVELTGIINKPLLLRPVGCLYYLYFIIYF